MRFPFVLGTLILAIPADSSSAQSIELRLHEAGSETPIVGAIIRLLKDQSPVAQGLTNEFGRLTLRAPSAGTYRLRIDRIGWTGMSTDALTLADGQTLRIAVPLASQRVALPELVVQGRTRCDATGGGDLAVTLWEEIRKALTANVLTQERSGPVLHLRQFVRELTLARKVQREWVYTSTLVQGPPFESLSPATLASYGFIQQEGDSLHYAAPDAALLLSDEFVGTHCFRAVRGPDPLVGLAFEPAPRRFVPEVEGTLWVDRTTNELRFLEYQYLNLEGLLTKAQLGGRVEFRRLPTGQWITSYWFIRMPQVDSVKVRVPMKPTPQVVFRVSGYEERGGRAEPAGENLGRVDRAVVIGHVHDSTTGRGLAGAVISLRGMPDSVVSDVDGRFELAVQASGLQVVTASHPKLALPQSATSRAALLSLGDSTFVSFQTPSVATVVRRTCGAPRNRSGLLGLAWGPEGQPAADLQVVVHWLGSNGKREERARSGAGGIYVLCDLPAGPTLPVWLQDRNGFGIGATDVELEWKEYRWLELRPAANPGAPPQSVASPRRRLRGGLTSAF